MTASPFVAVRAMEKKNRKAAIVTMIALNAVTGAIVMNNMNNARRLR
jgi:hypothetical protein